MQSNIILKSLLFLFHFDIMASRFSVLKTRKTQHDILKNQEFLVSSHAAFLFFFMGPSQAIAFYINFCKIT